ncbi:NADH dehydrogenase [ubiquinone] 1 alpha subcomplex subunit N7BM [Trichoderma asperellum]|uniref:NADH dehydrogenase [ubiquinone] 1 alpha subcomplex subunit n=1 Tax=Trichoderma asperellum TaxID=101201 RepID=A0A6V8QUM8_TRIAP|nr:NADH dehydrogenase [ubiquinone] 1 alpha subcomplex subunit N7BM [Trichoderma asperellum]
MSTITRTLGNLRKVGIKDYFRQMLLSQFSSNSTSQTGDTKAGTLIGTDRAGNKYYENLEELPLRTRWVDYAKHDYDAAHIEPGWHAWISYSVDKPPTEDALIAAGTRHFEPALPKPNFTMTRGAFKTYNT